MATMPTETAMKETKVATAVEATTTMDTEVVAEATVVIAMRQCRRWAAEAPSTTMRVEAVAVVVIEVAVAVTEEGMVVVVAVDIEIDRGRLAEGTAVAVVMIDGGTEVVVVVAIEKGRLAIIHHSYIIIIKFHN